MGEEEEEEDEKEEEEEVETAEIVDKVEENIIEQKADEDEKEKEKEKEDDKDEEEDKIGNITENQVLEYLKEHYKAHSANIISPHDIAKNLMKSQGVNEAQFQFHLNILGKVTYWIVNGMTNALGSDVVE